VRKKTRTRKKKDSAALPGLRTHRPSLAA
jgi:hypothetical protein